MDNETDTAKQARFLKELNARYKALQASGLTITGMVIADMIRNITADGFGPK